MSEQRPVRARCPNGGTAPCLDDLCYGGAGSTTLCGLEEGFDFCYHGYIPETCPEPGCYSDGNDEDWDWAEDEVEQA